MQYILTGLTSLCSFLSLHTAVDQYLLILQFTLNALPRLKKIFCMSYFLISLVLLFSTRQNQNSTIIFQNVYLKLHSLLDYKLYKGIDYNNIFGGRVEIVWIFCFKIIFNFFLIFELQ